MGLIAHYRLDGDATDAVGEYGGTTHGTIGWVDGKLGQAAGFDGSSGYIADPRISDYLHGRPEASIALWVKKDAVQYGFLQLSGFANSNGNLYPYNTGTRVYLDVFRTNRLGPIYLPKSTLEWHHCVITQSPGVWRLYQDGELVHETTANNQISTDYLQFEIGRNSGGRYADGKFQDVRIYDHALSPREVRDLSLGLVADYRFNGDLTDASGGNHSLSTGVAYSEGPISESLDLTQGGAALPVATGSTFSLSLWVKLNSEYTGGYRKFLQQSSNRSPGFWFMNSSNRLHLRSVLSGTTNAGADTSTSLVVGDWYHLIYQVEEDSSGTTIRSFLNGVIETEANYPGETVVVSGSAIELLGQDCEVAGLKLYSTALTPSQIKELYQQRASIDSEGSVHTSLISGPDERILIEDQTKQIYDNAYLSMGTWSVTHPNVSSFVESDSTLGTTVLEGWVHLTSSEYRPKRFEFTKLNNEQGVILNPIPAPTGGWKEGWNYFQAPLSEHGDYASQTSAPWDNMTRLELYRSGPSSGSDTNQSIRFKDVRLIKLANGGSPLTRISSQGSVSPSFSEVGVTRGLVAWYPLIGDTLDYAGTNHAVNNGAAATAEGYEFGGSDYLSANTPSEILETPQEWTVSSFVKTVDATRNQSLNNYNNGNKITHSGTGRSLLYLNSGSNDHYVYGPYLSNDIWIFLTFVYKQSTNRIEIYGNGSLYAVGGNYDAGDIPSGIPATTVFGSGLMGILRDVRIHNVALTPEEVAIQAKLALSQNHRTAFTQNCMYTRGQIKEVIA